MFFSLLSRATQLTFILLSTLFLLNNTQAATIYFVDDNSTAPLPDGTSWASAYPSIQSAIDEAVTNRAPDDGPAEVWVAEGTYTGSDENVVEMAEYVDLYGGFSGSEASFDQRNPEKNTVIIDAQSTRRCLSSANDTILDGFTLTNGQAPDLEDGGAIYIYNLTLTISNCNFTSNSARRGGAICTSSGDINILNCIFLNNSSNKAGAIYATSASPLISGCIFKDNNCSSNGGGAIGNHAASTSIISNCLFVRNTGYAGGAIWNYGSSPSLINNTFTNNHSVYVNGGIITNYNSNPRITNCIFQETEEPITESSSASIVTFCCIPGHFSHVESNMYKDPLFINPDSDNYMLRYDSPCIDAGTPNGAPEVDLNGQSRPCGSRIDLGAYELKNTTLFILN
jgi:predicted outer membrane repeat protein